MKPSTHQPTTIKGFSHNFKTEFCHHINVSGHPSKFCDFAHSEAERRLAQQRRKLLQLPGKKQMRTVVALEASLLQVSVLGAENHGKGYLTFLQRELAAAAAAAAAAALAVAVVDIT
jgi:hypothetical protein